MGIAFRRNKRASASESTRSDFKLASLMIRTLYGLATVTEATVDVAAS